MAAGAGARGVIRGSWLGSDRVFETVLQSVVRTRARRYAADASKPTHTSVTMATIAFGVNPLGNHAVRNANNATNARLRPGATAATGTRRPNGSRVVRNASIKRYPGTNRSMGATSTIRNGSRPGRDEKAHADSATATQQAARSA